MASRTEIPLGQRATQPPLPLPEAAGTSAPKCGLRAIRFTIIYELLPVLNDIQTTHDKVAMRRREDYDCLFDEKAWAVFWQGANALGFSLAGGVVQIGGGALGDEAAKAFLKSIGETLSKGGDVANIMTRSYYEVPVDAAISKIREDQQPAQDREEKQVMETRDQILRTTQGLGQQESEQFSRATQSR